MLQSCLGIGMPEMALHILDGGVVLHVRGRGAPECLVGQIVNTGLLAQRFQIPFQIIAYTERSSGRARKEESARIITVWMSCDPPIDLAFEVRRHRDELSLSSVFVSPIRSSPF